jgi:hypothetical protein
MQCEAVAERAAVVWGWTGVRGEVVLGRGNVCADRVRATGGRWVST